MSCGIYILEFNNTSKVYVGQQKNIEKRYTGHLWLLEKGCHSKKLQEAYCTYGIPKLTIILECSVDELDICENEAIGLYNSVSDGFNTLEFAESTPTYNKVGEEHCNCKYTNIQLIEAVKLICLNTISLKDISEMVEVDYSTIRGISNGTRFTWLADVIPDLYKKMLSIDKSILHDTKPNAKYSRTKILEAVDLMIEGKYSRKYISELTGISYKSISNIPSGAYPWIKIEYPEKYAQLKKPK